MIETFWLQRTDRERRWLRRFAEGPCSAKHGAYTYHEAKVPIEDGPFETREDDDGRHIRIALDPRDHAFCFDERWLQIAHCACGYEFTSADHFQVFTAPIYCRVDTGEEMTTREAPPGALWNAWWLPERWQGDDGLSIICKLPAGHEWLIDHNASNCTRPGEPHHCWVRHGTFGERLTVDKNGNTCNAGGGSVWEDQPTGWHGFLRDGRLLEVGET
jgi:hypothetical protein